MNFEGRFIINDLFVGGGEDYGGKSRGGGVGGGVVGGGGAFGSNYRRRKVMFSRLK